MMQKDNIEYIRKNLIRPVVIVGMMGAGKTTLARRLAAHLDWNFIDSDLEIEQQRGITIKSLFETKGEDFFRTIEKEKIAQLLESRETILSVGGGAMTAPETLKNILSKSLCIWLDAPIEILADRAGSQNSRPLLSGRNVEEALTEKMEQRRSLYEKAHLKIDGTPKIENVVENAVGQIYQFLLNKPYEV